MTSDPVTNASEGEEFFVGEIEVDGRAYSVTVFVEFDGIEHVGHLWFSDAEWTEDEGVRDHGAMPGTTPNAILSHARALTTEDLVARYQRAVAERRRFHGLRQVTQDVLSQIRHLNKVAMSMRAGLLDIDEAAAEIDSTELRLHEMVDRLRLFAGVAT
jgi:hypothetical protein